jgi:hypothetical protein
MSRLSTAAFWLQVWKQMILPAQDGQETQLSDLESLSSRIYTGIRGTRAGGTEHD